MEIITNTAFIEAVDNATDSHGNPVNIGWKKKLDGTVKLTPGNLKKIWAVTELNIPFKNLISLSGIEWFTSLTYLQCSFNFLTELDVSANTLLEELHCHHNHDQLTSLDVSGCTALTKLYCDHNQLISLDVSGCTALTKLYCDIS